MKKPKQRRQLTERNRELVARGLALIWAVASGIGAYALAREGAVGCGSSCKPAGAGFPWEDTAGAWQHSWTFAAGVLGLVGAAFLLALALGWKTRIETLVIAYCAQVIAVIVVLAPVAVT
jgi:hypothetical protein